MQDKINIKDIIQGHLTYKVCDKDGQILDEVKNLVVDNSALVMARLLTDGLTDSDMHITQIGFSNVDAPSDPELTSLEGEIYKKGFEDREYIADNKARFHFLLDLLEFNDHDIWRFGLLTGDNELFSMFSRNPSFQTPIIKTNEVFIIGYWDITFNAQTCTELAEILENYVEIEHVNTLLNNIALQTLTGIVDTRANNIVSSITAIKEAIEASGVTVGVAPIVEYADKVAEISDGQVHENTVNSLLNSIALETLTGSVEDRANNIVSSVTNVKNAIETSGVPVGSIPFVEYASKILEIASGTIDAEAVNVLFDDIALETLSGELNQKADNIIASISNIKDEIEASGIVVGGLPLSDYADRVAQIIIGKIDEAPILELMNDIALQELSGDAEARANHIIAAISDIKDAIEATEVDVDEIPLDEYADKVSEILDAYIAEVKAYLDDIALQELSGDIAERKDNIISSVSNIANSIENKGVFVGGSNLSEYSDAIDSIFDAGSINDTRLRTVTAGEDLFRGDIIDVVGEYWDSKFEKTNSPTDAPSGIGRDAAISGDGKTIAIAHEGDTGDAYLITYKWDEVEERFEKTNSPTDAPSGIAHGVALSYDGDYLAVAHEGDTGDAYLITYKWDEVEERFEKTNSPTDAPSGVGRDAAISGDGKTIAIAHEGDSEDAYLIIYEWDEVEERYEKTNSPDIAPSGIAHGVTMSFDGVRLAVAHEGDTEDEYLITYLWDFENELYEKTNSPDIAPSGVGRSVAMSNDGYYLIVGHEGVTEDEYLIMYRWDDNSERYEKLDSVNIAPTGIAYGVALSEDGEYLSVAHAGVTDDEYLITYQIEREGHSLRAYKSQNNKELPQLEYMGFITQDAENESITPAIILQWPTDRDPLLEFGAIPQE